MKDISERRCSFDFGPGLDYHGDHFKMFSSHSEMQGCYDLLLFSDSRGCAVRDDGGTGWVELVLRDMDVHGVNYLSISRPKELTVIFSLLNFLERNPIQYGILVTNVGFVDFTPKKLEFVHDIADQVPDEPFGWIVGSPRPICRFVLRSGREEALYAMDYGQVGAPFAAEIGRQFKKTFLVGTIEFTERTVTMRKRPPEFYSQLKATNSFLKKIADHHPDIRYLKCGPPGSDFSVPLTYDAVHLTQKGHDLVYRRLSGPIARALGLTEG